MSFHSPVSKYELTLQSPVSNCEPALQSQSRITNYLCNPFPRFTTCSCNPQSRITNYPCNPQSRFKMPFHAPDSNYERSFHSSLLDFTIPPHHHSNRQMRRVNDTASTGMRQFLPWTQNTACPYHLSRVTSYSLPWVLGERISEKQSDLLHLAADTAVKCGIEKVGEVQVRSPRSKH